MFESDEVTERPQGRPRGARAAVVPNVYPTGWGTLWAEIHARGQRVYLGTFRSVHEAAAAVAAAKRWRDRDQVEVPQPIVTRRPPPPGAEPRCDAFGR